MGCVAGKRLYQSRSSKRDDMERASTKGEDSLYPDTVLEWPAEHEVQAVPHKGEVITVKVTSVYDGDTCTILIPYGSEFMKYKLRVIGVDAPEIKARRDRSKDSEKTAEEIAALDELVALEKQAALNVRDIVKEMICDKEIKVVIDRHDKYGGRLLGVIHLPKGYGEKTLKDYLLQHGMAKEYYGQKKEVWTREELLHMIE